MTSIDAGKTFLPRRSQRADLRAARLLFCIAYPFCLAAAIVERLLPATRGGHEDGGARRPLFSTARASAASIIPFAFR